MTDMAKPEWARSGPRAARVASLAAMAIAIASAAPPAPGAGHGPAASAPAATAAGSARAPEAASGIAEARQALNKAIAFHREAKDLSLKFTARVHNADLDTRETYEGRLLLKGTDRFRLEIPGGTYVSDGKDYWEYHPRTRQAIRKAAGESAGQPLPADVLLRFLDTDPLSAARVRADGKDWLELRLDPSRAMKNLDSLAVLLDGSTSAVHRIASRDASGNEAEYTITSIRRNAGLKDRDFAFTPPEGTEIVDMRE